MTSSTVMLQHFSESNSNTMAYTEHKPTTLQTLDSAFYKFRSVLCNVDFLGWWRAQFFGLLGFGGGWLVVLLGLFWFFFCI